MTAVPGAQRAILLAGAVLFGIFAIVAFVFRRLDVSPETLSIVGGVLAYLFVVVVAVVLIRGWRRRGADPSQAAGRFLARHPAVREALGEPVEVGRVQGQVPAGRGPGQANLEVPVSGPQGEGRVDLVMARLGREWEVLSATLDVGGGRVALGDGPAEGSSAET